MGQCGMCWRMPMLMPWRTQGERAVEHRWNSRRPLAAKVILSSAVFGPKWARIRDIGAGGARVEIQDVVLPANLHVELIFIGNERGVLRLHRVPALIVWTSSNVAGLMFYEIGPPTVIAVLNDLWASGTADGTELDPGGADGSGASSDKRSGS